jgi:predicted NAD/FAD-binding protein
LRVAIVGSGISGLAVAHALCGLANASRHALNEWVTHGVDTGFLVLNERTYPHLLALFAQLNVKIVPSDMSFSVQVPGAGSGPHAQLEWSGRSRCSNCTAPGRAGHSR